MFTSGQRNHSSEQFVLRCQHAKVQTVDFRGHSNGNNEILYKLSFTDLQPSVIGLPQAA